LNAFSGVQSGEAGRLLQGDRVSQGLEGSGPWAPDARDTARQGRPTSERVLYLHRTFRFDADLAKITIVRTGDFSGAEAKIGLDAPRTVEVEAGEVLPPRG
jgi:hypothetical protein